MNDCDKDTVLTAANSVSSIPHLMGDDEEGYPVEPPGAPALVASVNPDGTSMYKYRDFGHVEEDDEEVNADIPTPTPAAGRGNSESSIRVQKFPVKLYAILAQKEFHDIICWMPHGRSWKVLKPSMFESLVMPLFFEYSNYHSFNRLVNAWSFRRISSGPDRGSYYHEVRYSDRGNVLLKRIGLEAYR
jgi:HSF-type DNA-binding